MAKKLIFRQLVDAREQIGLSQQSKEFCGEDDSLERKKLLALKEIYNYIKDGNWTCQEKSRKKVLTFIKNYCDYEKTREELGIKNKNSLEVMLSRFSKKVQIQIGANTIDLILEGRIDEAMTQYRTGTGKLNPADYIIEGLLDLLPDPNNFNTMLEDCQREIKFLTIFAKKNLIEIAAKHNEDNLAYLMYVLTSTDRVVATERKVLYQLLSGELENKEGDSLDLKAQIARALEEYSNARFN